MRLRCMAGAYAGQIRDYDTAVGLAALRTGTAVAVDAPVVQRRAVAAPAVASAPVVSHRDKSRRSK